jgi:non-homologous end joining protein Ku
VKKTLISAEEMQLLRTLMTACTPEKFDLARYQDRYTQKLTQLIETKVAGQEIVAAPASEVGLATQTWLDLPLEPLIQHMVQVEVRTKTAMGR